ncbi:MAG: phytanoyl-CoA dioxygenase family protein [Pseudomonadota bacterium]
MKNEKTVNHPKKTSAFADNPVDDHPVNDHVVIDHTVNDHTVSSADRDVSIPWDSDNQAWWDWYVGLADNTQSSPPKTPHQSDQKPLAFYGSDAPPPSLTKTNTLSFEDLKQELSTPYDLSPETVTGFQTEGYIKLPEVLSPGAVAILRQEIVGVLEQQFGALLDSKSQKKGHSNSVKEATPGRRFYSADMVWLENPIIRLFVLSPRIAKIAADLLSVKAVRLYHDNLLSKEPGCGRTPWHFDDHHFPLATNDVVTAWIAAQAIPKSMGPLAFAKGIDTWRLVEDIPFSKADTSYDRRIIDTFERLGVDIDDDPFAMGDVSFHHNLSFHTAGPNSTPVSRCVLANTFYADGSHIVDAPTMVSGDWQKFLPGVNPGELAASPLNPICWPARECWTDGPNTAATESNL